MKKRYIILAACLVIGGCAGAFVERDEPAVSRQFQDEAGKLPVGRIAAIQRVSVDKNIKFSAGQSGAMMASGVGLVGVLVAENLKSTDWSYHYSVQMKGGGERIIESQYLYKVGECLAFRAGLSAESVSAVRSLAGECD